MEVEGRVIPCALYSKQQLQEAVHQAQVLLFGVGTGPTRREYVYVAIHVRRQLSPKEVAGLPLAWRMIPGRDMAGDGTPITDEDLR